MEYFDVRGDFMNRDQIKKALIDCASSLGMSLSEFASEAGVSPSTITGFVNDISTRAEHVLSMRTIGKLTKKHPQLSTYLQIAEPWESLQEIRIIGLIDFDDQNKVVPLNPFSKGSIMIQNQKNNYIAYGCKDKHPILSRRTYFCETDLIIKENFDDYLTKMCVIDSSVGRFMGYLFVNKNGVYYLAKYSNYDPGFESVVDDLGTLNWLMPVDWILP